MSFLLLALASLICNKKNFAGEPDHWSPKPCPEKVEVSLFLKGDQPGVDSNSIVIPLKQAGRLFLIEARINDQEGNLIFDTGATELVLNRTYFRKCFSYEKPAAGGITGGFDNVYGTIVKDMEVSGLYYEKVAADLADLGHIEDKRGVKILGLFGLCMIDDLEVIFDAANNQLTLIKTDKEGNRLGSPDLPALFDYSQKLETNNKIMLIKGRIGEKSLRFCLDTGAEINVLHCDISKKVMESVQINRRSTVAGAASRSGEALYGIMNELELGTFQFGSMGTVIMDLSSMSESYGCSIDGMLGYDFWVKGVFCFNCRKNIISFNIRKESIR